ncbi:ABC transporter permease subunit [Amycolatopsis sp., V23-08]|uniref:ABC transporter permease subunit n=1 Tax=Amycolatopsis heterodermiae TaxID=3110235 RepID=A0ABU5RM74_9PSEU|nr:ABC transporter permease subunit [Amycolatopsis sp., V23-08]MEA5367396.1 ABC transporter permease subunit [Amycolatopsis sp., V23-08]
MRRILRRLAGVAVLLLGWEGFSRSGLIAREYFPPPSEVVVALARMLGEREFLLDLIATLLAWLIAVGVAVLVAVPAGLLLGSIPLVRTAVGAVIEFLRPIPAIMWFPLFYIILMDGAETKIMLAAYAAAWPILFNIVYALGEVERGYVETARSFGLGRLAILLRVKLPDVVPFAITSLRIAATFALLVVVSTELVFGGDRGVGIYLIRYGEESGRLDIVLAGAVVAGVLGYLSNSAFAALQRKFVVWAPGEVR